ncbi:DUF6695 family protein [Flavobacteriaceae bacterium LMO-SS05]
MSNNGIILTLAYPETVVMISDEWFLKYLRFFGIGKLNYVRAGHAALVLIHKEAGSLEYFDFGRYISPSSTGRVRSKVTDLELDFQLNPVIEDGSIVNLEELLVFFATHPELTHGKGTLYASVCDEVNFEHTKTFITNMQDLHFIRYAAFVKKATNCARFVTDALIAGVTNPIITRRLIKSKWLTPSTLGNVVIADTKNRVYKLTESGAISMFKSSVKRENRRLFLDPLRNYQPSLEGRLQPKHSAEKQDTAQWLSGIGEGAWFELYDLNHAVDYRFRRISPNGRIDVDGIYKISHSGFNIHANYDFTYHSNCSYFHIKQGDKIYRFEFLRKYHVIN